MKKLFLVLGVLVSSAAMAEGNVVEGRLGYSFKEGKLTEDVTKKVVLTGEYRREVMPNLELGLGLDVKRADEVVTKKVDNNYAMITRTGLPVYAVAQYNFKNDSDVVPYIKGKLGVVVGRNYEVKEVVAGTTTTTTSTTTTTPSTGATTPSTGVTTPSTGATTPSTGATTPSTGATTPSTGATTPSTGATTPSTGATTPSAGTPAAPAPAEGTPSAGTPAAPAGPAAPVANAAAPAPVSNVKKELKGTALYAGIGVGVNYKNFVVDLSYNYTQGRKLAATDLNDVQTNGVKKEAKNLIESGSGVVTLSVGYTLGF